MVSRPIIELGVTALGKIQAMVQGVDHVLRILDDDIVPPLRQVESDPVPKHAFLRRERPMCTPEASRWDLKPGFDYHHLS